MLLLVTAELDPSASFWLGTLAKPQLDSRELGSAGFRDELDVGTEVAVVVDSVGCTGAGSVWG